MWFLDNYQSDMIEMNFVYTLIIKGSISTMLDTKSSIHSTQQICSSCILSILTKIEDYNN